VLPSDDGRDVSAAGGDVEHQVLGIAGLPVHLACGLPSHWMSIARLGEQRVRDFNEVALRTLAEIHRLEIMAQR